MITKDRGHKMHALPRLPSPDIRCPYTLAFKIDLLFLPNFYPVLFRLYVCMYVLVTNKESFHSIPNLNGVQHIRCHKSILTVWRMATLTSHPCFDIALQLDTLVRPSNVRKLRGIMQ